MKINKFHIVLLAIIITMVSSCSVSRTYPKVYYEKNKLTLHQIEHYYKLGTEKNKLGIAFIDLDFQIVTLEIKTDTVRYVYNFDINEQRKNDTLYKYGFDISIIDSVIQKMKQIQCTWVNKMNFDSEKGTKQLVFMSVPVKQFSIIPAFRKRKYYLFNFYAQPQYYDEKGRLLDKRTVRRLRKVNREIFYRVTNQVAYTISNKFR